jgi:sphinganine-1-phosphate aldolase
MGHAGYAAAAGRILSAADALALGIAAIPGLAVLGEHTMVVAFRSTDASLDIYAVNDALTAAGWHLNALQRPAALHFCVTDACCGAVPALLAALAAAVGAARAQRRAGGKPPPGAMAPVYGLAGGLPDRGAVVRASLLCARVRTHTTAPCAVPG